MSLYKQLWISIALLMSLAFLGSFIVSCLSAKTYLNEQLYRKNLDNASALALSLSSQRQDEMTIALFINSQFDTGHYHFIRLTDPEGKVLFEQKEDEQVFNEAPEWLIKLFPIDAAPGIAQVSSGWQQLGTLSLRSQTRFAYKQLWDNAKRLLFYFIAVSLASGILGSILLKLITQPLHKAVDHAVAIGERRFITTEEPKTIEFRDVIRSMNKLSRHVKAMLEEESAKLEKWRKDMQFDKVSGLLNRNPILSHLNAILKTDDERSRGAIVLIRISDLFKLNQIHGRKNIDALIKKCGETLILECKRQENALAGRLNGSDFLILLPGEIDAEYAGRELYTCLTRVCKDVGLDNILLLASNTFYQANEAVSDLLARLDSVLESASAKDTAPSIHVPSLSLEQSKNIAVDWQEELTTAIMQKRFKLVEYPVCDTNNSLLHYEAPVRLLREDGALINAGEFMPHINRFDMGASLDLIVTELACQLIVEKRLPIGINLSASLLAEPAKMAELAARIANYEDVSDQLWLEVPEYGAFQNMQGFRTLCQILRPLNCKLGIEHIAHEVSRIGELHDLGLHYVKIDRSLIQNIDHTTSTQVFLRGLSTIVRSIGLQVIAEGVTTEDEWKVLIELGIDGGTGAFFPLTLK